MTAYVRGIPNSVDPTTATLQGFWRGSYSASPWAGTASAGGSSGRNLSEATHPPTAGTAVNTFAPAVFNGTNQLLSGAALTTYMTVSAWTVTLLVNVTAVNANGNVDGEGEILGDSLGTFCLGSYSSSGNKVSVQQYDGSWKHAVASLTTGAWQCVQARYDGTNLSIRVNGGAWANTTCGSNAGMSGTLLVGESRPAFGGFFSGQILELEITSTALSDSTLNGILTALQTRYGVSIGGSSEGTAAPTDAVSRAVAYARGASESLSAPTDAVTRASTFHRAVPTALDPTLQALDGFWRGSFSASPWTGAASAGGSSGRTLSEATHPPTAGSAVNGLTPAAFNGTNTLLTGAALSTYITASAWTITILANITAVCASGNSNGAGEIIGDNLGTLCLGSYNASGNRVSIQQYDGAWKSASTPVTTGAWQCIQAKYDGANLSIRVNGGAWSSSACGNNFAITGLLLLGESRAAFGNFLSGSVLELEIAKTALSDFALNCTLAALETRYSLTLGSVPVIEGTVAPTDAAVRALTTARAIGESKAAPTDAPTRAPAFSRSLAESIAAPADAPTRATALTRVNAESVAAPADAPARALSTSKSIAESVAAPTDAPTRAASLARACAESSPIPTDAAARAASRALSIAESTAALTDAPTRAVGWERSPSESVAAPVDSAVRASTAARSIAESLAASTDAADRAVAWERAIAESLSVPTDAVVGVKSSGSTSYSQNIPESAAIPADAPTRQTFAYRSLAESVAASTDAATRHVGSVQAVAESAAAPTDAPAIVVVASRTVAESVTAPADAPTRSSVVSRALADAIARATDAAARRAFWARASSDDVAIPVDVVVGYVSGFARSAVEFVAGPTDAATKAAAFARSPLEVLLAPLDPAPARRVDLARVSLDDVAAPTDAIFSSKGNYRSIAEALSSPLDAPSIVVSRRALVVLRAASAVGGVVVAAVVVRDPAATVAAEASSSTAALTRVNALPAAASSAAGAVAGAPAKV